MNSLGNKYWVEFCDKFEDNGNQKYRKIQGFLTEPQCKVVYIEVDWTKMILGRPGHNEKVEKADNFWILVVPVWMFTSWPHQRMDNLSQLIYQQFSLISFALCW